VAQIHDFSLFTGSREPTFVFLGKCYWVFLGFKSSFPDRGSLFLPTAAQPSPAGRLFKAVVNFLSALINENAVDLGTCATGNTKHLQQTTSQAALGGKSSNIIFRNLWSSLRN